MMYRILLLCLTLALVPWSQLSAQGLTCAQAEAFCTDGGVFFPANSDGSGNGGGPQAEPGNNYGCLGTQGNPSWYYIQIDNPGNIDITLSNTNNIDIDFALWGPFNNLADATSNCGSLGAPTDCSYLTWATEFVNIPNSSNGQVYLLLITNYTNQPTSIVGTQTGGTGSTDCSILPVCDADAGTVTTSSGANTIFLCDGASGSITSNDDFVLPDPAGPDPIGLGYAIYNCPPTTGDPSTDPCWTGWYWTGEDLTEINDPNSLYNFVLAEPTPPEAGANGIPTGNDLYLVPITMDDICPNSVAGCDVGLDHDLNGDGCFDMGPPTRIVYIPNIIVNLVPTCDPNTGTGSFQVTLSGGLPSVNGSNFTVTDAGAGTISPTSVPAGGTFTISGLSDNDVINFSVADAQCSYGSYSETFYCGNGACLVDGAITANPPNTNFPNDQYPPGTTVEFCIDINRFDQTNINFLLGIVPTLGPGWDLSTLTPTSNPAVAANNEVGSQWSWFPGNTVTENSTGISIPDAGWWFQSVNSPGGFPADPDNGYGDGCTGQFYPPSLVTQAQCNASPGNWVPGIGCTASFSPAHEYGGGYLTIGAFASSDIFDPTINQATCNSLGGAWDPYGFGWQECVLSGCLGEPNGGFGLSWTACFEVTSLDAASCTYAQDLGIEVNTWADGETGTWTQLACQADQPLLFDAEACCVPAPNASNVTACEASPVTLTAISPEGINWFNQPSGGVPLALNSPSYDPGLLPPGTYTYYAEAVDNGCVSGSRTPVTLTINPLPDIQLDLFDQVICPGASATIQTTITDATSILWDDPAGSTSDDITVTPASTTTYTVTASNACGSDTYPVVITINPALNLSANPMDENCADDDDGSIDLTVTGGAAPYTYDWDYDGTGDFDDPEDPSGLAAGTYTVVVNDFYLCSETDTYSFSEPPAIVDGNFSYTGCQGDGFEIIINGIAYNESNQSGTEVLVDGSFAGCDSTVNINLSFPANITGTFDTTICNGETFVLNGTIYGGGVLSGVDTFTSANLCDSVVTITVNELPLVSGTFDTTVCVGETFVFNGTTYGGGILSGSETLTDANGCDSVVTVTVNEFAVQSGTFDTTVCVGETFVFNGTTYGGGILSGSETLTDANGCDSVVTVTVNEFTVQSGTFDTTVCVGETFVFNGTTYGGVTLSGTETFTDANGCDSVVTVTVNEFAVQSGTFDTTVCVGETFVFNGTTYGGGNLSGSEALIDANGCDSVVAVTVNEFVVQSGTFDTTVCVGETFVFNGTTYGGGNLSGSETLTDMNGCDSIVTVTVNEFAIQSGTFDTTVCVGETFVFNGTTYGGGNLSGLEILTDANGCDSVVTVTVNEFAVQSGIFDTTVCVGETFVFNGTTYGGGILSGSETLTDANGCDSVVTVTVNEFTVQSGTFDTTVCVGETFVFNGTTYGGVTLSGTETFTDANGCDSVVTVTVNEFAVQSGTFDTTVCVGETFVFNGTTYGGGNLSGSEALIDANGCDSLVTVTVTELPAQFGAFDTTICAGETFIFNGTTYGGGNLSGSETLTDANGCDSVVTVTVNEFAVQSGTFDTTVCVGETFIFNGTTYGGGNLSGSEALIDANGCDSLVTVTVTELPAQFGAFDTTICAGETFVFNGTTYGGGNLSGSETLTDMNGCDSVVTVTVNEFPIQTGTFDTTVCVGETFIFNGTTYGGGNLSGSEALIDANGCDSLVTVTVTELPAQFGAFDTTICAGDTFVFNGNTYGGGVFSGTEFFDDVNGCDSTVTVTVTELPLQSTNFDTTICSGETFVFNGTTYGSGNLTGTEMYTDVNGCDSTVVVTVTELAPISGVFDTTVCNRETFVFNGTTYGDGLFTGTEVLIGSTGCDSVVTVNVTELPALTGIFDTTVCNGETFIYNGTTYGGGNFTGSEVFIASDGCDSTVVVTVTELPLITANLDTTICNGETFVFNETTYGAGNFTGTETISAPNGCASIVTVTVTELPVYAGNYDSLVCVGSGFSILVNGTTYDESNPSGMEVFIGGSYTGCDSTVTINLIFDDCTCPAVNHTEPYTGCAGDGYSLTVNGTVYNESNPSGIEVFPAGAFSGCDSIVTVDFFYAPNSTGTYTETRCAGDGFAITINGTLYDEQNPTGTETLQAFNGCDSVVTIDLAYLPNATGIFPYTGCQGDGFSITVNGTVYDEQNPSGTETLPASNGCDSIVTIDLTYLPNTTGTFPYTGCQGDGFAITVNSTLYDEQNPSGTETLTAFNGCDSVVTVDLFYDVCACPSVNWTEPYSGCSGDGYSLTINGTVYDESNPNGVETFVSGSFDGCDSIVTVDFFYAPNTSSTFPYTGCQGDGFSITVNSTVYDEQNPGGTETLPASNGCDSVVTINLNFLPNTTGTFPYTGCQGDGFSITVNGTLYDEQNPSGTETLTAFNGCDSVVTVDLFYDVCACPSVNWTEPYSGCSGDGYSLTINGTVYDESNPNGMEMFVGGSFDGCDSIVTVDFFYAPNTSSTFPYTGCQGDGFSITVNGTVYDEQNPSGTETLTAFNGCDSVVTVDLFYDVCACPSVNWTEPYSGCSGDGYSLTINGTVYDESNPNGVETFVSGSFDGCDSTVTIDLTYLPNTTGTFPYTGCQGDGFSITVNGTVYDEQNPSGTETLTAFNGCDSVVTVDLFYDNCSCIPVTGSSTETICQGDSTTINGQGYYSATGVYVDTVAGFSCDSIVTLNLTVEQPPSPLAPIPSCQGESLVINGLQFADSTAGVYTVQVAGTNCEPLLDQPVIILPYVSGNTAQTICDGSSATINGVDFYSTTGIYSDTIPGSSCDSIVTLDLTVTSTLLGSATATSCDPAQVGTFVDTVMSSAGCDSVITTTVTLDQIAIGQVTTTDANCAGSNGSASITVNTGTPPFSYQLTGAGSGTYSSSPIQPLDAGDYQVILTDDNGCRDTVFFMIDAVDSNIVFNVSPDYSEIQLGESVEFDSDPATGNIQWSPSLFLDCDTCAEPISTPDYSLYYVISREDGGCYGYDTVFVEVNEPGLLVPTAFTPDGDSHNDVFHVIDKNISEFIFLEVYNRWGELLFRTTSLDSGWDGFYLGDEQEMDTYIYHLSVVLETGKVVTTEGIFLLLR